MPWLPLWPPWLYFWPLATLLPQLTPSQLPVATTATALTVVSVSHFLQDFALTWPNQRSNLPTWQHPLPKQIFKWSISTCHMWNISLKGVETLSYFLIHFEPLEQCLGHSRCSIKTHWKKKRMNGQILENSKEDKVDCLHTRTTQPAQASMAQWELSCLCLIIPSVLVRPVRTRGKGERKVNLLP